jgi:hypothetical protein
VFYKPKLPQTQSFLSAGAFCANSTPPEARLSQARDEVGFQAGYQAVFEVGSQAGSKVTALGTGIKAGQ